MNLEEQMKGYRPGGEAYDNRNKRQQPPPRELELNAPIDLNFGLNDKAKSEMLSFARQSEKKELITLLSQAMEIIGNTRRLLPEPVRSAVPTPSSALRSLDNKMAGDMLRGLTNLSNKQSATNALSSLGVPFAYHLARFSIDALKRKEFDESQYDYGKQKALDSEMKDYLITLDRFKESCENPYQQRRNEEPKPIGHPNRGELPIPFKIPIGKTWNF